LIVNDKVGMIADVLNAIAKLKLNIEKLMTEASKHGKFMIFITVSVEDELIYDDLVKTLRTIPDVINVEDMK